MQPLHTEFLQQIARQYDLTTEQQEVFVLLFSTEKSPTEVADELHISETALRTRMTGVYQKFSFTDKKPNKSRRLHDWLLKQKRIHTSESKQQAALANADIEELVKSTRQAITDNVKELCGKMQVLDMTQAIGLNDIYTDVNILKNITANRRLSLLQLQNICNFDLEKLERIGLGEIAEERIAGIEAVKKHSKLVIWGKP
ncbi:MAG: signal transduction protein, partial [Cyanobacteria bacterium J06623_7]